jgi:hypothetical protein
MPVLLLITGSFDGTADRVVAAYGPGVFRLNYDLWRDYEIFFSSSEWRIVNSRNGLVISSNTITAAFWWKPFVYPLDEDSYVKEEVNYIFRDLYGWCVDKGIARGNHFTYHSVFGKISILNKAMKYFKIPDTYVSMGKLPSEKLNNKQIVVKSLATARTNDGNILITTEADVAQLDPIYPWCIQELIDSEWDITTFYCDEQCFTFKRSRADLSGLDWRAHQSNDPRKKEWFPVTLAENINNKIVALSRDLNVSFGRYDFLLERKTDDLVFLELNAHGQWVFLDYFEEHGLLDCVINWLKR